MKNLSSHRKPWLTPHEQVEHLQSKGVRFDFISKGDAEKYLAKNNNYFRLRSYRKGFSKVEEGTRKGEYSNLDFIMLVDLSVIDMLLRFEMLPMTLDIEHFSKLKLLGEIGSHLEDGYSIVEDFLARASKKTPTGNSVNLTIQEIEKGKSSPYISSLLDYYPNHDYPAWAFMEIVSFGTFIHFQKFCAERFDDQKMKNDFYLLQTVKSLRNACAHNNCILNDLVSGSPMYKARNSVSQALGKVSGIGESMRKSKMRNDRIQQITTTMYMHRQLASEGVHIHRAESLQIFKERMNKNHNYYIGNYQVLSTFDFISKVIDGWFNAGENAN